LEYIGGKRVGNKRGETKSRAKRGQKELLEAHGSLFEGRVSDEDSGGLTLVLTARPAKERTG